MVADNDFLIPAWPEGLQHVDVVKARFTLNFTSPCSLQPADFLALGRVLRLAGRQSLDSHDAAAIQQWQDLFQPALSDDPVARRKFQKPAPAFVITMPVMRKKLFSAGDQLELEVLFLVTSIPLIHNFLRSLIHLGQLGLVAGKGHFEVSEVHSRGIDDSESLAWRHEEPLESLTCSVFSLTWLLQEQRIARNVTLKFVTPTRLMVEGKPLRKPDFTQVFPFMLRRTTSMLHAHSGVEVLDDPTHLLTLMREIKVVESRLLWHDWRPLSGQQGLVVGGFVGEMVLDSQSLDEIYWVLVVASLFGLGKGATYGAGRFVLSS
jgi:hypothetical protein